MRRLLAAAILLVWAPAQASMEVDGAWRAGVWATTAWAAGVWFEGEYVPPAGGIVRSFFPIEFAEKLEWLDAGSCPGLEAAAIAEADSNAVWARRNALGKIRVDPMAVPGCARPAIPAP